MNDTIEILKAARQLIENREDWWDGKAPQSPRMLCTVQAVSMAVGTSRMVGLAGSVDGSRHAIEAAVDTLRSALPPGDGWRLMIGDVGAVSRYNDTHSHKDVLALFDRAALTKPLGIALSFGWTTSGLGKDFGPIEELLPGPAWGRAQ